jgi:phage recombination protein Bet
MEFTPDQVELIKRTVAVGATDDELQLFMYVARKTGLDPFTRQIYALKRWNKAAGREVMAIQTGIDGFRVTADRTGKLAGISDPIFDDESGQHPNRATVTVKKLLPDGTLAEFTATARWSEYVQLSKEGKASGMWAKMPYLMLGKCAEALALRKAFPADLSGVYTTEEMAQADNAAQGEAVHAEVERQKAGYTPDPAAAATTLVGTLIPPELDWSYVKSSGVLICRITDVQKKVKKGSKDEFLALQINQPIDGKRIIFYWHKTHIDLLLASMGKIAKLTVSGEPGLLKVDSVLEIDGQTVPQPAKDADTPADETKARLLASDLGWTEEELQTVYKTWADGSWKGVIERAQEAIQSRDEKEGA